MLGLPVSTDPLRRCMWLAIAAQALLVLAGLRHNLVWGASEAWPWLPTVLGLGEAACVVGYVVLGGLAWWRAMQIVAREPVRPSRLYRLTLPIVAVAIVVPLFATTDPVDYVMRGRILALHGGNPYVQVATDYPHDPFVAFGDVGWKGFPLPYGPIVACIQGVIAAVAHALPLPPRGELIVAIGLCKIVFAAALFAAARLLQIVANTLHNREGRAVFLGVMWNPLLLFECVANAHNESLVMVAFAAAVTAVLFGRHGLATFSLGLGTMTKLVPIAVAPMWAVVAFRRRATSKLAMGVGASLVVAAVFWWWFFRDPDALGVVRMQAQLASGGVYEVVHQWTSIPAATLVAIGRGAIGVWIAFVTVRVWFKPHIEELVFAAASSLFLLATFGSALSGPWYHAWWIPLALLFGRGWLWRAATVASVTAPLAHLVWLAMREFSAPAHWCHTFFSLFVPVVVATASGSFGDRSRPAEP